MAHNVQEAVNGISLQGSKMSEMQNGHMSNGVPHENGVVSPPPPMNGTHRESNGIATKHTNMLNLDSLSSDAAPPATQAVSPPSGMDQKTEPLTPDLVSQSSSVPSEPTASSGGVLIDLDQSDIHEASTASLTPASPPADGASGLESFDPIQPSVSQTVEACPPPASAETLFGQTGQTLEDLGVQETPAPPGEQSTIAKAKGGLANLGTGAAEQNGSIAQSQATEALANCSEVPPPAVPKEAFTEESAVKSPPSPGSPSKLSKESKLPKKTPPASPKKKLAEPKQTATPKTEASGGARPKTAPAKVASPKLTPRTSKTKEAVKKAKEEERPQTAPSSKIPSPKKERTPLSTPKKQDGASDSGTEEDRGTPRSKANSQTPSSSDKKKYGIDSKNSSYKPAGGNVKIFDKKVEVKAECRVDSKPAPKGGTPRTRPGGYVPPDMPQSKKLTETIKTMTPSPNTKEVTSKVGSLKNAKHSPGGGNVKIVTKKDDFSTVTAKCGSTANLKHTPGGGQKKIESKKLEWKAESRVGSMQNAKHRPKGGDKKIETHKVEWNAASKVGSMEKAAHKPGGGEKKIESHKVDFREKAAAKIGSTKNIKYQAGGGDKKIETQKLEWNVGSKIGSLDNTTHRPGGGEKKIENHKLDFKDKAAPKIGSTANMDHQPGGGDKAIESHKLDFREKAAARTKHGLSPAKVAEAAEMGT